jgi:sulfonate transport system permease protein
MIESVELTTPAPPRAGVPSSPEPARPVAAGRRWQLVLGRAVLALWSVLALTDAGGRGTIPAPWSVVARLWDDRSLYPAQIGSTVAEAVEGLVLATVAGVVLGAAFELWPWVGTVLNGPAITLVCVPALVWAPLLAIAFSPHAAKVGLAAIAAFLPVLVGTMSGLRCADPQALQVITVFGGSPFDELRKVKIRAAVPLMVAGLRVAVPAAVLGATIGEFIGGDRGLGIFMVEALRQFMPARIWGAGVVVTALGVAGYVLVGRLGRRWIPPVAVTTSSPLLPRRSGGSSWRGPLRVVLAVAVTVGLWRLAITVWHLDSFFAKTPSAVVHFLLTPGPADDSRTTILRAMGQTLPGAGLGIVLGMAVGVAVAVACVLDRRVESTLLPFALVLQSVPLQAFSPILVLIFGRGLTVILVISVIISFFPTVVLTSSGLRNVAPQSLDVLHGLHASEAQVLTKLRLPAAIPALFASARIAVPSAILGVLIAEYLATSTGIGHVLSVAQSESEFSLLWATAAVVTLISAAAYAALGAGERLAVHRFG